MSAHGGAHGGASGCEEVGAWWRWFCLPEFVPPACPLPAAPPLVALYLVGGQTGAEKLLRIFDLERPDAEPVVLPAVPSGLRNIAYINEATAVTTCLDTPGIM